MNENITRGPLCGEYLLAVIKTCKHCGGFSEEIMDYVILHELVHLKMKNHSKQFWAELDEYVGSAKELDKKLRKHRLGLVTV